MDSRLSTFDGNEWVNYTEKGGVNAIKVDNSGRIWIGRGYGGVSWFDGEKWTTYNPNDHEHIYSISVALNGEIWVGSWGGLLRYNGSTWKKYTQSDGLPFNWVIATAVDHQGKVWFGTYDYGQGYQAGISCYDGITVKTYKTVDGFMHGYAKYIAVDNKNVWVANSDGGVSKYDGQKWIYYTTENGLAGNYVSSIVVAPDGVVWFGTSEGVSRYESLVTVTESFSISPSEIAIVSNYPNPFNPSTTIEFSLDTEGFITLDIYNVAGQRITTLVSQKLPTGFHSALWDGRNTDGSAVTSGIYFSRLTSAGIKKTGKMLMMK